MPAPAAMNPSTAPAGAAVRSPRLRVADSGGGPARERLVESLLREQRTLTAVERFSRFHARAGADRREGLYSDLLPLEAPRPGQQYAFEVDLDACTGCKACVAACHNLNGLDEDEVWRTVGVLHGGTPEAPAQRTVTTSCHHCVEPACLAGCPVRAYEKDRVTGIVKHLDDQCIGCQYCTFMCPYDAPKYSRRQGIVRKCDMCSSRLAAGEAPACVQGCPNGAIRIRVIDQTQAIEASEAGAFLPGAPAPDHTMPTTVYRTARPAPANLLPADFYRSSPEHAHLPLVGLLVLTQLAVGTFAVGAVWKRLLGLAEPGALPFAHAAAAAGFAVVALFVSALHLGRPLGAWRAFLGLGTSWMSREILGFGAFVGAALAYTAALGADRGPLVPGLETLARARAPLEVAVLVTGLAGVMSSVMIYGATRRSHWRASLTGPKFLGTAVVLGLATTNAIGWVAALALRETGSAVSDAAARGLLVSLMIASGTKLVLEAASFANLRGRAHTVMKRVAILMVRDLRVVTGLRFACGALGGLALPLLWLGAGRALDRPTPGGAALAIVMLALVAAGELLERYLFFAAAPPSRMPGGLA
jgi:Fe-S-cluster-containing dehydrogenase component/DMSO reductase anchor subunit